jgi:hypothetical protein
MLEGSNFGLAEPGFTFHLKGSPRAYLPAVARPITDEAERAAR